MKRTVEEWMTALTVARSSKGIKLRVLSLQEGLSCLTVSSVLQFKLSVEPYGFSTEPLGIINAANHLKEVI